MQAQQHEPGNMQSVRLSLPLYLFVTCMKRWPTAQVLWSRTTRTSHGQVANQDHLACTLPSSPALNRRPTGA